MIIGFLIFYLYVFCLGLGFLMSVWMPLVFITPMLVLAFHLLGRKFDKRIENGMTTLYATSYYYFLPLLFCVSQLHPVFALAINAAVLSFLFIGGMQQPLENQLQHFEPGPSYEVRPSHKYRFDDPMNIFDD